MEPKKKEKSPAQDTRNLKQVYHFSETIHRGIDTASNSNQGSDFFRVGGFISGWRRRGGAGKREEEQDLLRKLADIHLTVQPQWTALGPGEQ